MERLKHFLLEDESPDPGLVYRTLRKMEEDGWVSSEWVTETSGPAKRIYTLTGEGKTVLRLWAEHVRRQVLRLQRFLEEYEKFQRESEHHG
jgi:DNA-binding PadR family transcriptional regulator